jgi:hypothetical protein
MLDWVSCYVLLWTGFHLVWAYKPGLENNTSNRIVTAVNRIAYLAFVEKNRIARRKAAK